MAIGISYIDHYIPESKLDMYQFLENLKTDDIPASFKDKSEYMAFISNTLKLDSVRIETEKSDVDMLEHLISKMFYAEDIEPDQIDCVIFAQEGEYVQTQNIPHYIQYRFKLNNSFVMQISGGHCANMELAVESSRNMINGNVNVNNVLIISTQKVKSLKERAVGGYAVLADGASIALVSRDASQLHLQGASCQTNGYFHDLKQDEDAMDTWFSSWLWPISVFDGIRNP